MNFWTRHAWKMLEEHSLKENDIQTNCGCVKNYVYCLLQFCADRTENDCPDTKSYFLTIAVDLLWTWSDLGLCRCLFLLLRTSVDGYDFVRILYSFCSEIMSDQWVVLRSSIAPKNYLWCYYVSIAELLVWNQKFIPQSLGVLVS